MRLEQLNYIIEITKLGSFSKVAEKLYISQPALSTLVKNLETELGVTIFKRTSKGVFLTAEGKKIVEQAVQVKEVIDGWYVRKAEDIEATGEVHIACTPVISSYVTPNIIVPFQKQYPGITIFVHGVQQYDVIGALKSSTSNIALTTLVHGTNFLAQLSEMNYEAVHIFTDERRIFMGCCAPLASKQQLTLDDLKELDLAWYSDPRDIVSKPYVPYFASSFRLANKEDILALVMKSIAVFIQPWHLFQSDYRVIEKLIVGKKIPINEIDPRAEIYALRGNSLSACETLFWDYLLANWKL